MPRKRATQPEEAEATVQIDTLAQALTNAIESARPKFKNVFNRKVNSPWSPKDGKAKLKPKRPFHQHGILIPDTKLTNEQIELINQLKPGVYDNFFRVTKRKDKGIDIDYPVKTSAQRLRMITQYGIRTLDDLLKYCVEAGKNPIKVNLEDE